MEDTISSRVAENGKKRKTKQRKRKASGGDRKIRRENAEGKRTGQENTAGRRTGLGRVGGRRIGGGCAGGRGTGRESAGGRKTWGRSAGNSVWYCKRYCCSLLASFLHFLLSYLFSRTLCFIVHVIKCPHTSLDFATVISVTIVMASMESTLHIIPSTRGTVS